jgi:hypothetical protein
MLDWRALYERHEGELVDFWGRRRNAPSHRRSFFVFGRRVVLASNEPAVLQAAGHSAPLFSIAPPRDGPSYHVRLIVAEPPHDPGELPGNLFDHILYAGEGQWISLQIGRWGHAHAALEAGKAAAVLAPSLAASPAAVSRYLLNTLLLNFLIASGLGFLHATGLERDGRVLLLMGGHNQGKSTTALRLTDAGFRLLGDSHVFVEGGAELTLYGFPVGRLRLRPDVLGTIGKMAEVEDEPVRGELKHGFDLRRHRPDAVAERAITPRSVTLCLLSRGDSERTLVRPAPAATVLDQVMANSLYYDAAEAWGANLEHLATLLERSQCHEVQIGRDPEELVRRLGALVG